MIRPLLLAALAVLLCPVAARADAPRPEPARVWYEAMWLRPLMEKADKSVRRPEAVRMLTAMATGGMMRGEGWFGPSQFARGWDWLRARSDVDKDGRVTRKEFRGPAELFDRLDRDRDGAITAEDFDWSPSSPFLRQTALARQWFQNLDADSNGRVSRAEWAALFDRLAQGKDFLTAEDLQALLTPPGKSAPKDRKGGKGGGPSQEMLFRALLANELGSPYEGPRVGTDAPNFTLPTHDGQKKISLSDFRGKKPVALLFGNFT